MGKANSTSTSPACPLGESACPIYEEVDSLRAQVGELAQQVRTDHLTGLFNIRHLHDTLEQEMERTKRGQQATTLMLLDVDHFKSFNDTHGHVIGDQVLQHLAALVKAVVRKIDVACRYGGEEFAVLLPATPTLIGAQVAERLRRQVAETALAIADKKLAITVSVGVDTFFHHSGDSAQQFVERVDKQLYLAKTGGRNRVCHATHKVGEQRSLVSDAEKAALFDARATGAKDAQGDE